jgi:hypothetical protein
MREIFGINEISAFKAVILSRAPFEDKEISQSSGKQI